jgi:hypothetical protein
VLAQPLGQVALEPRAAVAELGQLDEVLELQVVDVVDQTRSFALHARGGIRTRKPLRAMDFESIA